MDGGQRGATAAQSACPGLLDGRGGAIEAIQVVGGYLPTVKVVGGEGPNIG